MRWQALPVGIKGAGDARALVAVATVTALIGWAVLFAYSATASAAPLTGRATEAGRPARPADGSSAYDWPQLHLNPQLSGYAANGTVSTANAAGLGVRWATDLYGAILDSPVIAYDPASGQTLAYVGTDTGNFFAIDKATGAIVWAVKLAGPVQPSPLVSDGAVWVATRSSATIYKLDASTGAIDCSHPVQSGVLFSSPVAATPPGGTASVYFAVPRSSGGGKVLSVSAATCATQWSFSGYQVAAGTWDPLAYAVDALGEPLVLFGSSDPDDAAYAIDAVTGTEVWRYQTKGTGDADVGSGLTSRRRVPMASPMASPMCQEKMASSSRWTLRPAPSFGLPASAPREARRTKACLPRRSTALTWLSATPSACPTSTRSRAPCCGATRRRLPRRSPRPGRRR